MTYFWMNFENFAQIYTKNMVTTFLPKPWVVSIRKRFVKTPVTLSTLSRKSDAILLLIYADIHVKPTCLQHQRVPLQNAQTYITASPTQRTAHVASDRPVGLDNNLSVFLFSESICF